MPKNNKKGIRRGAEGTPAKEAEDFDDMLAELRAADLTAPAANTSASSSISNRINATTQNVQGMTSSTKKAIEISDDKIMRAVERNDVTQLRRWIGQGLCVISSFALFHAVYLGNSAVIQCLVKEIGADVNQGGEEGTTPMILAAQLGYVDVLKYCAKVLHADVNKGDDRNCTPLWHAARQGHLSAVKFLVKDLGVNINQANLKSFTPLMAASYENHEEVVRWLVKAGADLKPSNEHGTAANISKYYGASRASPEQTAYLEAKTHCLRFGCSGAGLLKCTGCKQARYCGEHCQLAHWKVHKADCRRLNAELEAGTRDLSR
jgi:hypothetical protein